MEPRFSRFTWSGSGFKCLVLQVYLYRLSSNDISSDEVLLLYCHSRIGGDISMFKPYIDAKFVEGMATTKNPNSFLQVIQLKD